MRAVIRVLPILLGLSLIASPALAQKVEITTEDGIPVVHNPVKPAPRPDGPSRLVITEDLVIGKEQTGEKTLFAELTSVGADGEGFIWTLDRRDVKIRIFDAAGKPAGAFGRQGQGPGEWEGPIRMDVLPDGTAAIQDQNKYTVHSRRGECLKELPTTTAIFMNLALRVDSRGFIHAIIYERGDPPQMVLRRFDGSLKPVADLARTDYSYGIGKRIQAFTPVLYFHIAADDRITWGVRTRYELFVLDRDGKPIRRILKDYAPVPLDERGRKRILEYYNSPEVRSRLDMPADYPPMSGFTGDPEGRVFVRTYDRDAQDRLIYDVFDTEGRCFTRFALPENETIGAVVKDKLYVMIEEDDEGRPLVKRYAMAWN